MNHNYYYYTKQFMSADRQIYKLTVSECKQWWNYTSELLDIIYIIYADSHKLLL